MRTRIALLILWFLTAFLTACDYASVDIQRSSTNVPYASFDDTKLDVFLPAQGNGPFPIVLLVHGTDVDKDYFQKSGTIEDLTAQGYAAVSINYRAPGLWNPDLWLSDTVCALAWIHAHASEDHFDTNAITAFGHSRGAYMVALLGSRNDLGSFLNDCEYTLPENHLIRGIITYGGAFGTPTATFNEPDFISLFGATLSLDETGAREMLSKIAEVPPSAWLSSDSIPEAARQFLSFFATPWVDGSVPPFMLIHGDADAVVPVVESRTFADILEGAGVSVDLLIIPGGHHAVDEAAIHDELLNFLASIENQE